MTAAIAVTYSPRFSARERELAALPGRLRNLGALVALGVQPATMDLLRRHWNTRGAAFGHPWASLTRSTILARTRRGTIGKGPLRDTDTLFNAVFTQSATRIAITSTGARLSVSPRDPKWVFHQLGTRRMVARQVVPQPFPRSFRETIRSMARDYILTGQIRGAGGRFASFGGATQ